MVITSQRYAVETLNMTLSDINFSAAKLFFAYGLGNGMTFPLWVGGTALLTDQRPTPDVTFDLIEQFRPTLYFGVPTLYAAQLLALEKKRRDFSSLRACVSAGEALPAEVFRRWQEHTGLTILDGIGSTELLHIFISNRLDDCKPGTSGRLVPGYEAPVMLAYSARNRSASIRIPYVNSPKARRIEVRFPDPAANPYLAFAALMMAGLDGIQNKIHPGDAMDKDLYDLPKEEALNIPKVAETLSEALDCLQADHEFLTRGGVFTEDMIKGYIDLKRGEVERLNMTTHPVEFDLYYSC